MRIILILLLTLFLLPFSFASPYLNLMHGSWDCSEISEDDGFITNFEIVDTINTESLTFTSNGLVTLKSGNVYLLKLKVQSKGIFTVKENIFSPLITDVDVEVLAGDFPEDEINLFKQNLLTDKTSYKTIKIDDIEWVALDLTDNTENTCTKI